MNDQNRKLPDSKPIILHPAPLLIEDLLQYVDPAPDDETERFVAAIYADRREAVGSSPLK